MTLWLKLTFFSLNWFRRFERSEIEVGDEFGFGRNAPTNVRSKGQIRGGKGQTQGTIKGQSTNVRGNGSPEVGQRKVTKQKAIKIRNRVFNYYYFNI